jgi:hypothetical protein
MNRGLYRDLSGFAVRRKTGARKIPWQPNPSKHKILAQLLFSPFHNYLTSPGQCFNKNTFSMMIL